MLGIPNESQALQVAQAGIDTKEVDAISAAIAGTGVLTGGGITAGAGLTLNVAAGTARLAGTYISFTGQSVNPGAADATNPRFDLIVVDSTGTVVVLAGTPAAAASDTTPGPVWPAAYDPTLHVLLYEVYVPPTFTGPFTIGTGGHVVDKRPTISVSSLTGQVQLDPTVNHVWSLQEGGQTMMNGTFTPYVSDAELEIDCAGTSFSSWGGASIYFYIGVLPSPEPVGWEPGGKNKVVRADNLSNTAMTGVTEFQQLPIGHWHPNERSAKASRKIVFGENGVAALVPGRQYAWELRIGGVSYYKNVTFATGSVPKAVIVSASGNVAYVTLGTSNKLAVVQLGGGELFVPWTGSVIDMAPIAEIPLGITLSTNKQVVALQPKQSDGTGEDYFATYDSTAKTVVLVNLNTLKVDATYVVPNNDTIFGLSWSADGTKLLGFVGTSAANSGWYELSMSARTWSAKRVFDAGADWIQYLATSADGTYYYLLGIVTGKVWKVNATTLAATLLWTHPGGAFTSAGGTVRVSDETIILINNTAEVVYVARGGVLLNTLNLAGSGQTANAWYSVRLSATGSQIYLQNDNRAGWWWVDSGQKVNWSDQGGLCGDIYGTYDDGIVLAHQDTRVLGYWPGGQHQVRSLTDGGSFGDEHVIVTARGGVLSGT